MNFGFKKIIIVIIFVLSLSFLFGLARGVMAQEDYGLGDTKAAASNLPDVGIKDGKADIPGLIGKVVGAGLAFVGVLFFILMIYGGLLWMTAQGNEQQVTKAKDLIIAAVVGLVIVLSAYAITAYIGGEITSTPAGK